ncbi:MAG: hypothetical protein H6842_08465, partial [Rhodospirillaceae bacterium]|nr:hypothetical protein [Rhodospirillaceae bacterium]
TGSTLFALTDADDGAEPAWALPPTGAGRHTPPRKSLRKRRPSGR